MKLWTIGVMVACTGLANAQSIWTNESRSIGFNCNAADEFGDGNYSPQGALDPFIESGDVSASGTCGKGGSASAAASASQSSIFSDTSLIASGGASCSAFDASNDEPCGASASAGSQGTAYFTVLGEGAYVLTYDLNSYYGGAQVRLANAVTGDDIEQFEARFNGQVAGTTTGVLPPGDYSISWSCAAFAYPPGFEGMSTSYNFSFAVEVSSPLCPADFNQDGGVDGGDIDAFFLAWEAGDASADTNQDVGVDGTDVDAFFIVWEVGGC